jgi:hypothetical protein
VFTKCHRESTVEIILVDLTEKQVPVSPEELILMSLGRMSINQALREHSQSWYNPVWEDQTAKPKTVPMQQCSGQVTPTPAKTRWKWPGVCLQPDPLTVELNKRKFYSSQKAQYNDLETGFPREWLSLVSFQEGLDVYQNHGCIPTCEAEEKLLCLENAPKATRHKGSWGHWVTVTSLMLCNTIG